MKQKHFRALLLFMFLMIIVSACDSGEEASEEVENSDGYTNMSVFIAENGGKWI
ncbi:hypothetical protein [Gracilibacillus sp. JCM 18860]|uniref:hypothetical protein n=1 Tax=Gracilibacillus sp. JCM 18860 TaxID=1306159 RepID=UPI000ACDCA16